MNSIDLFAKNWGSKNSMVPIASDDIAELESRLNAFLPDAYKYLISTYGLVHTPNVFTKIVELGSDISEVQDFLSLEDVASLSKLYEMTGMPAGHILFASDSKGNMFCFKRAECESKQQDASVWYYDPVSRTVTKITDSFTEWLDGFNQL